MPVLFTRINMYHQAGNKWNMYRTNYKSGIKSIDALNPTIAAYLWESAAYFPKSTKDLARCLRRTAKFHLFALSSAEKLRSYFTD